ncbi:MAG TPA: hypothetical protein V6D25_12785 [Leptolyngbyaceae cyanobacterium]
MFLEPLLDSKIFAVVVGGLIGFYGSNLNWKIQKKYERINIAYAMCQEFYIRNLIIKKVISTTKDILNHIPCSNSAITNNSICTDKDLFYIYRKEISGFDRNLSNSIVRLYIYLEDAEKQRKKSISSSGDTQQIFQPLLNKSADAQRELNNCLELFTKNFGFSEDDFVELDNEK